jgi:nitrite reductase/ring-hydroxylating ferredoxin subunit
MTYTKIGELRDLEPHGQFSRWVEDHDILVYRHDGQIKAISNICPHFGGPVGFHKMKDGRFTCLWHNFQFSAEDGRCVNLPKLCLRPYKLKVEGDSLLVQLVEVPS